MTDGRVMLNSAEAQAREALWNAGRLDYKLRVHQMEVRSIWRDIIRENRSRKFVVNCSRRFGKSRWFCTEAVEYAINNPGSQQRYAAPLKTQVRSIVLPLMREITADAPEDKKGRWHSLDGVWRWPNGSELWVAGCDKGGAESLRGVGADRCYVDEAGFVDNLRYVIQSVLLPQTLTNDGYIAMASTPPISPAHHFTGYCAEAAASGCYLHHPIYDNPFITAAQIQEYMRESGGEKSSDWKREYLGQFVVDDNLAIVPEWLDRKEAIIMEWPEPTHYHAFCMGDVGYSDLTVFLLGYWDFENNLLVIQDEVVLSQATSDVIDATLAGKERALWAHRARPAGHKLDVWEPQFRVLDAPKITVADMRKHTGRSYMEARKDDAEAALNRMRLLIQREQIRIHPRCVGLIAHLDFGIWNKSRSSFARSGTFGHFDAIDALKYGVRHAPMHANPFPQVAMTGVVNQMVRQGPKKDSAWGKIGKRRR